MTARREDPTIREAAKRNGPQPEGPQTEESELAAFREELVRHIPYLRAFARTLCNNRAWADDLAQDTLMKAWRSRRQFTAGTNMKAWLYVILRNQYYSDYRRLGRSTQLSDSIHPPATKGAQEANVALGDLSRALADLPPDQREALILVGAGGFAYEDAARVCNCAVGTIKSRVARARRALETALEGKGAWRSDQRPSGSEATEFILQEVRRLSQASGGSGTPGKPSE